jgi:hypothetical protein
MMKENVQKTAHSVSPEKWARRLLASIFLVAFFLGYNATTGTVQQCRAQVTAAAPTPGVSEGSCGSPVADEAACGCASGGYTVCIVVDPLTGACDLWDPSSWSCFAANTCCTSAVSCDDPGQPGAIAANLASQFSAALTAAEADLEAFIYNFIRRMMQIFQLQLQMLNYELVQWWKTMWWYNLHPSLQAMTRQMNADLAEQVFALQQGMEAQGLQDVNIALQKHAVEDQKTLNPDEQLCTSASAVGGYERASNIGRSMRLAWENDIMQRGLNTDGGPGSSGVVQSEATRYKDVQTLFCDPKNNTGWSKCTSTMPQFYNADVQPTKFLFNQLTIDVANPATPLISKNMETTIETIINNMVGVPSVEPFQKGVLESAIGKQGFVDRRSYLARYAAIRSVPQLIASWRMPGSQMAPTINALRAAAGVPASELSSNPSYKEVMHAITVDRFNSGHYAAGMLTDAPKAEIEKLTLNVFYLMQLRDYYELLERTALTLAVQVSLLTDHASLPSVQSAVPLK